MPLENPNVVDMIATPSPGQVRLVIKDNGNISNPVERLNLLEQKLETYMNHIHSSEFMSEHEGIQAEDITIAIVTSEPPTPKMKAIKTFSASSNPEFSVAVEFDDAVGSARNRQFGGAENAESVEVNLSQRTLRVILFLLTAGAVLSALAGGKNIANAKQVRDSGKKTTAILFGDKASEGITRKKIQVSYSAVVDGRSKVLKKKFALSSTQLESYKGKRSLPIHYLEGKPNISYVGEEVEIDYLSPILGLALATAGGFILFKMLKK